MATRDPLERYKAKRDFSQTPEPAQGSLPSAAAQALAFVVQKHAARNLHYDFRLELQGTLKSWAVPKGPSLDPRVKRMAVQVEDHPVAYAAFEGTIPPNQYGSGDVIVWDRGVWLPVGDPVAGLESGKLKFELQGEKLTGGWALVRMHGKGAQGQAPWLLIKEKDAHAQAEEAFDITEALPGSVLTGRPLPEKAALAEPATAKARRPAPRQERRGKPPVSGAEKAVAPPTPTPTSAPERKKKKAENAADAAMPGAAIKTALPDTLSPQLATLVDQVPADPQHWVYEIKFDGYRLLTRIDGASVRCMTRAGNDWSGKLPKLVQAIARLGIGSAWLDGEIVVMNSKGLPDFGGLQNAFDSASTASITYYVFDIPFYDGQDLRRTHLTERRGILRELLLRQPQPGIRFSEAFDETPQDLLASAQEVGLEGVIGKRKDSFYASGRSADWIKLKTQLRQEFVIGGYTEPKGTRTGLGALLLGVHEADGSLRYAGNVGTGFDNTTLRALKARLSKLHQERSPFGTLPTSIKGQWVRPELLAEVAFGEWTHKGHIRHAVFQGLRIDKPARLITQEIPVPLEEATQGKAMPASDPRLPPSNKTAATAAAPAMKSLRVTHGERVIDSTTGFTKLQLIEHYAAVAPLMLPHLKNRPVALLRAPGGLAGTLFFQKHAEALSIPGITLLDPSLDPGHGPLLEIPSAQALLGAAQFNAIEFHTWNATRRAIHKPDRMTFDLDPGEGVPWPEMQEAAQLVRTLLEELGLVGFLKTSGGKGLHVVVPLKRAHGFETVKDFSHAIVDHLASVLPQRFAAKSGAQNRVGKIFVDYLRNGFGATTVTAWSVRARPGLGVSVPLAWDELALLTSGAHWTAPHLAPRLAIGNTPWHDYEACRKSLAAPMKKLGFKPAKPSA
ncbi:MAG: ATP-dependent ligase LigD polymerase module / ATP-dependent ligase LigD phosphoesterase [Polaromonas sp.]|nr:ATP-dependent ligase LigD polymerase module / ATP-dependent ligase LigD phosphoesterase [Polaromonas sp.]